MSEGIKILVIGSNGQIGSVLTNALSDKYGSNNVIGSDLKPQKNPTNFIFEQCSVLDKEKLKTIIHTYKITDVYLLAACLSAKGEKNIERAWDLNVTGLMHILNFAKEKKIKGGEAARSMRGAETRTAKLYEAQRDSLTIYKKG